MDMYCKYVKQGGSFDTWAFQAAKQGNSLRAGALLLAAGSWERSEALMAASVTVANGNFSNPANDGSVGAAAVGAFGSGTIGAGPWVGGNSALLGLLSPPVLTISTERATYTLLRIARNRSSLRA